MQEKKNQLFRHIFSWSPNKDLLREHEEDRPRERDTGEEREEKGRVREVLEDREGIGGKETQTSLYSS